MHAITFLGLLLADTIVRYCCDLTFTSLLLLLLSIFVVV